MNSRCYVPGKIIIAEVGSTLLHQPQAAISSSKLVKSSRNAWNATKLPSLGPGWPCQWAEVEGSPEELDLGASYIFFMHVQLFQTYVMVPGLSVNQDMTYKER